MAPLRKASPPQNAGLVVGVTPEDADLVLVPRGYHAQLAGRDTARLAEADVDGFQIDDDFLALVPPSWSGNRRLCERQPFDQ